MHRKPDDQSGDRFEDEGCQGPVDAHVTPSHQPESSSPKQPVDFTVAILKQAPAVAQQVEARFLMVCVDSSLPDSLIAEVCQSSPCRVILAGDGADHPATLEHMNRQGHRSDQQTAQDAESAQDAEPALTCASLAPLRLPMPEVAMSRMGRVKVAMFLAATRGLIHQSDRVVCISGAVQSGTLDTLVVIEADRNCQAASQVGAMLMHRSDSTAELASHAGRPEVLQRVLELASSIAQEGREGRPVGTIFVLGNPAEVLPRTRQLILNPFQGHPPEHRNLLDTSLDETIKELASLDGAFAVGGDGVVHCCGAYLDATDPAGMTRQLPKGLGARHHAAAAITAVTEAVAVTVSESTGTVTVFARGRAMIQLDPQRQPMHLRSSSR